MRTLFDTLGGLWELLRLAWISRFRFRGAYWQWRMHTAFGRGKPPLPELIESVIDYGRWVYRTRRMR
ncbi:MAG: hypothetical protein SFY96_07590 [Planctomycetota bacterium]|nr:hypothetical protein [Planctomycetota bacterium]